jgi:pimeloyl-ACP methyl ester carboxylesterase
MPFAADTERNDGFVRGSVLCASRYAFHRVSFTDWGRGGRGTVVCVHGLTRQGRDFDYLAAALANQGYRVICPDLVGRGLSDRLSEPTDYDLPQYVLDMTTLIAHLRASEVTFVGSSLGGLIGIVLAGMPASPIRRLVVNDVGPYMPADAVLRICRYVMSGPRHFATEDEVDAYFRDVLAPFGQLTAAQWRHLAVHSIKPARGGGYRLRYDPMIARGFKLPSTHSSRLWAFWDNIRCPTLLLRGAESDLLRRATAAEMAARHANMRLIEVPGCGHLPPLLDGAQIRLVSDWIEGNVADPPSADGLAGDADRRKASQPNRS